MRSIIFALAMLMVGATAAAAQTTDEWGSTTTRVVPVVRPIVGARFPLECTAEALKLLDERAATGKIVLDVS